MIEFDKSDFILNMEKINNSPMEKFNRVKIKKGSALAAVLVMVVIIAITLTSLLGYISSQIRFSKDRVERERAFQIAEAGAYYFRWYLAHNVEGRTAAQVEDFWLNGNPIGTDDLVPYITDFKDQVGNIIGQYQLDVQKPVAGSTIVTVKSTGWTSNKPSVKRVVQVRFRRPSWSEYTFLSNSFMNFGSQSVVYGKVHSNEGIRFDGKAYNTVSSSKASFDDPTRGGTALDFGVHTMDNPADPLAPAYPWVVGTVPVRSDIFVGGREFPVPNVSFTGVTTDLGNMKTQAQAGNGKYFGFLPHNPSNGAGGRRINIKNDGTYDVCAVESSNTTSHSISGYWGVVSGASGTYSGTEGTSCATSTCCATAACPYIQASKPNRGKCVSLSNYPIINDGVIFVEDNVWVEGSVSNKRITLAAANLSGGDQADIYIGISNKNLTLASFDCNNMLGLVAQKDVRVLNDCPSNFRVDAALLAQNGLVGIVNGMGGKFSLTFNGAIASYLQPFFQNGSSGFADRTYNFNNKLLYCPPAYFPTGTEYAIDLWDEL